ncbi:hypothetical protein [Paenibacillus maysiensis]|uniref:hypothetical protein n=1 Tax=Paenibacillus maysiensis TaxID=1155954 RepID=UPI0004B4405F|nr:hypothetical protein [Paenibacillus maysiensis]
MNRNTTRIGKWEIIGQSKTACCGGYHKGMYLLSKQSVHQDAVGSIGQPFAEKKRHNSN